MNQFIFPKQANENDFEDIVCDIFARRFQNPNLQRYGRKGQAQDGLDITGFAGTDYTVDKLVGIQCKNHPKQPTATTLISDVDDTLEKFKKSPLKIDTIYMVTSAEPNKEVQDYVTKLNEKGNKPAIEVLFWNYITDQLGQYPDLLYKYFTKYLPTEKSRELKLPDATIANKTTLQINALDLVDAKLWSGIKEKLTKNITSLQEGITKTKGYNLYIGVSTKKEIDFEERVDLSIDFSDLFGGEDKLDEKFANTVEALKNLLKLINEGGFSRSVVLYSDAECSLNFLIGRIFRLHKIELNIVSRNQLWSTNSLLLPYVRSEIEDDIPERNGGKDGVIIVDIREKPGTPIKETVSKNIGRLGIKPDITISCKVAGNKINDAAQAFSVAEEISKKIISLDFCKKVHLFFAVPKALATLVGFFLSTTLNSELCLYFLNQDRTNYLHTGCINNKTF